MISDPDVTILQGDALEQLATLPSESVHCIVTSPPYNTLGSRIPKSGSGLMKGNRWLAKVNATGYADDMDEGEYAAWLSDVAAALLRVAKPGASFFFNHKVRYRDRVPIHPLDLVRRFEGWHLRQEIIWDRHRAMAFNARMFAPSEERVYWLVKPGADYTWHQSSLAMSVWTVIPDNDPDGGHPCPFPTGIPSRCILATTNPGDVVLDPFMGTGSTLVAARADGRQAWGVELNPEYIAIAAKRLQQLSLLGGAA